MSLETFERLVDEALDGLPELFRERLENVEVIVEEWPDRETMRVAGARHPTQLLGFYHGVPLPHRTHNYGLVLPDKISIYRQPILRRCRSWEEARELVRRVVQHEIAHYFGIDDDRLEELGAY